MSKNQIGNPFTRREFLQGGSAVAGASLLGLPGLAAESARAKQVILLFLTGGPSQIDTFDPKPNARSDVRGPFRPISTRVPGIQLSELLPRTAEQADKFTILRSVTHSAAPIHETGQQLLQTGRLCNDGVEYPHFGSVMSQKLGSAKEGVPAFVILPRPLGYTGVTLSHGQGAGNLGAAYEPVVGEALNSSPALRHALQTSNDPAGERFGRSTFGDRCHLARRLIEAGVRCVTVNMFESVYGEVTWDCHGDRNYGFSTLEDYRHTVCPAFDQAYSALLQDLHDRGSLDTTLVVAMGEFGRTPVINSLGGRDHWPGVWSILLAGGGTQGGQVIGLSDALGAEPRDRPTQCSDVFALIQRSIGI